MEVGCFIGGEAYAKMDSLYPKMNFHLHKPKHSYWKCWWWHSFKAWVVLWWENSSPPHTLEQFKESLLTIDSFQKENTISLYECQNCLLMSIHYYMINCSDFFYYISTLTFLHTLISIAAVFTVKGKKKCFYHDYHWLHREMKHHNASERTREIKKAMCILCSDTSQASTERWLLNLELLGLYTYASQYIAWNHLGTNLHIQQLHIHTPISKVVVTLR